MTHEKIVRDIIRLTNASMKVTQAYRTAATALLNGFKMCFPYLNYIFPITTPS